MSFGERIAAVSGVVLFVSLFLDWLEELTAWELFGFVDVLLALLALTAVALAVARGAGVNVPRWPLVQVGVVALTLAVAFLIEGSEQATGIWLCALAAAGMLSGGAAVPRRARRPRRPQRPRPRVEERPIPPRGERPAGASEPSQLQTRPHAPGARRSLPSKQARELPKGSEDHTLPRPRDAWTAREG